jgi:hypothetical protein
MKNKMNFNIIGRVSLIVFIFIGILNQPYGYYEFLRIFVSFISIFLTIEAFKRIKKTGFEYLYLGLSILFNPIFPIYLSKDVWILFDLVSVILLGISLAVDKADYNNIKKKYNVDK